jgi:hypothetical protein
MFPYDLNYNGDPNDSSYHQLAGQVQTTQPQVLGTSTGGTGNADQMWNEGWNSGFNSGGSAYTGSDPNYSSGYNAGWQEYLNRNSGSSPTPNPAPNPNPQPSQPSGPSAQDLYRQQMEGQINSGYNNYFGQLDAMVGDLSNSAQSQTNQANLYSDQQISDLQSNSTQNISDLNRETVKTEQNQVKTLKDISDNIRNLMQGGNTYLGSRGAGDSSAVNQYAYALTKLGSKQRGDAQTQVKGIIDNINDRISKVKNIATQETNRIKSELGIKTQEIGQWLSEQQMAIKQAKANGELSKSQDLQALSTNLYNQAVQSLTQLQNAASQRMATIESWALSNSTSAKQAIAKAQEYASYQAPSIGYTPISGTPTSDAQGNVTANYGGGVNTQDEYLKKLLGLA